MAGVFLQVLSGLIFFSKTGTEEYLKLAEKGGRALKEQPQMAHAQPMHARHLDDPENMSAI